ncbi:MAG: phosphoribosylaminoimidazolesuccinocarboxamide synthase [Candidatus Woesearchaeota archaeon]
MVSDDFKEIMKFGRGCAVIMAGSDSDMPHIKKIGESLKEYEIPYEVRICSAHKQPGKLKEVLDEYNKVGGSYVIIAIAGGTDALSGTASFHALAPVISCPPDAEKYANGVNETCLMNPPGSSNAYIKRAGNVGRFVAQMFAGVNVEFKEKLIANKVAKIKKLEKADCGGEKGITKEVLDNTLQKEIFPEINVVSAPRMGKVRIVYDVGDDKLILVSSDALSTHDVVHKRQVYAKGENLNAISSYYFGKTKHIIPNHFIESIAPNTWLTHKAEPILVEMVFRQYLTGSGWRAYVAKHGPKEGMTFCGVALRAGYRKNEKLGELIFTPTAKGQVKDFDIPEFEGLDPELDDPKLNLGVIRRNYKAFGFRQLKDVDYLIDKAFELYRFIYSDLDSKGYLLADTKWEFGYLPDGTIGLIDECVTPDSSRFWNKEKYALDASKNEFTIVQDDKQYFRDIVEALGLQTLEKKAELAAHHMSDEEMRGGVVKYCNIRKIITGEETEITTEPRKERILTALKKRGFLK